MRNSRHSRIPARSQFGVLDLQFATFVVAVSVGCWFATSWDVGVSLAIMLLLFWCLRKRKYAVVPGAVLGTIVAWATLGVGVDVSDVLSRTALFATVGAAINSLVLQYWVEGLFALVLEIVATVLIPLFWHS